jgi:hypothetical protein
MNSEKAFNGVDTQRLSTVFSSLQNHPEMAKVSFSIRSEWNGGFGVGVSASKGFRAGGQNIERNSDREIGKRFSPAFDTLTNGTSVVVK